MGRNMEEKILWPDHHKMFPSCLTWTIIIMGKRGAMRSKWNHYQKRFRWGRAVAGRGKLVAAVVAGMLSAPKRGQAAFSGARIVGACFVLSREKVGPLNILTMIWKWPFQKMLSHSNPTNWIFYRRSLKSKESVTEQRFFLCVCLSWSHQMCSQQNNAWCAGTGANWDW